MKYRPYCIPCFLRRTLHTAELATSDEWLHRKILGEIMADLVRVEPEATPPEIVQRIFRKTARTLGLADPYAEEKRRWQEEVLANQAWIREKVDRSEDPFLTSLKLCISANQLDNELRPLLTLKGLVEGLDAAPFDPECLEGFRKDIEMAKKVLFIHDTAGELFFDRLLIEKMGKEASAIASVVRQSFILAEATLEDARRVGLEEVVGEILDPGIDCLGIPLGECSGELRKRFQESDLILVKGQAGYQSLEGRESTQGIQEKEIFFLLAIKCPVMASALGVGLGELVLDRG